MSKQNILENGTLSYVIFDEIQYKCKSVTWLPLTESKQLLDEIINLDTSLVAKVKYTEGYDATYFDLVKAQGLEGIVLKRKNSRYKLGKCRQARLKVINTKYDDDDVFITGIRKGEFGLLLSFLDENRLV